MGDRGISSPWPGPDGLIPITSGKADDANLYARAYLDAIHVEMRVVGAVEPRLTTRLFGEEFSSPIMMPAFSHLDKVGKDGARPMVEYARAARDLGVLNWVGMESDEEFADIASTGARTVRVIKPFSDHGLVREQIAFAEEQGAIAVGMDIDHVPGTDGRFDIVDGKPMGTVTVDDIASFVQAAKVPFVAKGVLSVTDAARCRDAGVAAIVVSHHHGRLPFAVAPAQVLPDIAAELDGSGVAVFADGHVDSGYDAYKLLALGAQAVAPGRSILGPLLKEGAAGVVRQVERMNHQLAQMMMYTGVADTSSFSSEVLW